jgi:hypothetical protein
VVNGISLNRGVSRMVITVTDLAAAQPQETKRVGSRAATGLPPEDERVRSGRRGRVLACFAHIGELLEENAQSFPQVVDWTGRNRLAHTTRALGQPFSGRLRDAWETSDSVCTIAGMHPGAFTSLQPPRNRGEA